MARKHLAKDVEFISQLTYLSYSVNLTGAIYLINCTGQLLFTEA